MADRSDLPEYDGAHAEITALIHRYATGIDTRDWQLFESCFTADAVCDYGEIGRWTSAADITAFMAAAHVPMRDTKHMMHNTVVNFDGPQRATAVTYVHTVQALAAGGWVDAVGQYEDELARTDAGWKIAGRVFTLTRMLTSHQLGHG